MSYLKIKSSVEQLAHRARTPIPLATIVSEKLQTIADKWDEFTSVLEVSDAQAKKVEQVLPEVLLYMEVSEAWKANKGAVMTFNGESMWQMLKPNGKPYCDPDIVSVYDIPTQLKYPLGILQMQDDNTMVSECGMRVDKENFYVMEKVYEG
jgi:hypothetical protein